MSALVFIPEASSAGLLELKVGAEVSITIVNAADSALVLPAASVAVMVISCVPSERVPLIKCR